MTERMTNEARLHMVAMAALDVAKRVGYRQVTREAVAVEIGVHRTLINYYVGKIEDLRDMLVPLAVDLEVVEVVAQGLAAKHPAALEAPEELQDRAVQFMRTP